MILVAELGRLQIDRVRCAEEIEIVCHGEKEVTLQFILDPSK
jgi:hypothetical protein